MLVDDGIAGAGGASLLSGSRHRSLAGSFPLLAISLTLFALLNLISSAGSPWYLRETLSIHQMSGDVWQIRGGDVFLSFSMILLFVEIIRATSTSGESIINHALSVLVFVAAVLLFVSRPGYGNSTFFMFTGMTLLDFVAGFIITTMSARRDTSIASSL
jgi:hypothetical protein